MPFKLLTTILLLLHRKFRNLVDGIKVDKLGSHMRKFSENMWLEYGPENKYISQNICHEEFS